MLLSNVIDHAKDYYDQIPSNTFQKAARGFCISFTATIIITKNPLAAGACASMAFASTLIQGIITPLFQESATTLDGHLEPLAQTTRAIFPLILVSLGASALGFNKPLQDIPILL